MLRRRWVLILALAVVGAALGAASTAFGTESAKQSGRFYKATNTQVVDQSASSGQTPAAFQGLNQVAIFTTTGEVPDAVAKKLGTSASGRKLAERILTTTDSSTDTVAITAIDPDPQQAVVLADTFAQELVANLDQRSQDNYTQTVDKLTNRLNQLQAQQDALAPQLGAFPRPADYDNIKAQYDALVNQYRLTYDSYAQLAAAGPPTGQFTTLQSAEAVPISRQEYNARLNLGATGRNNLDNSTPNDQTAIVTASSSSSLGGPLSRGVLGAFLGLLVGIGLALMLDRLDRRIRSRADAEAAFQLPVLAEVPELKRNEQSSNEIVAHSAPLSRFAEAHRAIRSSLLFSRAAASGAATGLRDVTGDGGTLFEPEHGDPFVIMITSAAPGEGKTTTTANLAAVFAEAGASVLVVNCDFRRPMLHKFFGIGDEPRRVHETAIKGVKVVTNVLSDPAANPAQVVAAQRQVVAAARGRFDVILLDTAPLLTANDAVELVGSADLVLLVARIGATTIDSGQRTMELLNRLDVDLGGVVLVGATAASNDYYYYYQPGRVDAARSEPSPNGKTDGGSVSVEMFPAEAPPAN